MSIRPGVRLGGIACVAIAAVALALVSQHVFDMQPCPWCVLQRLVFVLVALVALVGVALRGLGQRIAAGLIVALGLAGAASFSPHRWRAWISAGAVVLVAVGALWILNAAFIGRGPA